MALGAVAAGRRRCLGGGRPRRRHRRGTSRRGGRYEFTGITKQAKFAYGKTAITIAALLVAIQWPLHMNAGIQSILTTQVAIYVLLAMGLNVVVGFAGLLDLGYVAFWAIGCLHDGLLHRRASHPTAVHPQPVLDHPLRHRGRDAHRRPARDAHACACAATTSPS